MKKPITILLIVIFAAFLFADDSNDYYKLDEYMDMWGIKRVDWGNDIEITEVDPNDYIVFDWEPVNALDLCLDDLTDPFTLIVDGGEKQFTHEEFKQRLGFVEDEDTIVVSEIIRVYDGDTFYCKIHQWPKILGENIGIRVNGIDTPETRGLSTKEKNALRSDGLTPEQIAIQNNLIKKFAQKAKAIAFDCLTKADCVVLKNIKRGKYFRVVADVEFDGKDLANELIKVGLAKPYDGGTKDEWDIEDVNEMQRDLYNEALDYVALVIKDMNVADYYDARWFRLEASIKAALRKRM